jgi:hypothetical protein
MARIAANPEIRKTKAASRNQTVLVIDIGRVEEEEENEGENENRVSR